MKCPVCLTWSDHHYPTFERAKRLADHIAEHSMLDCVLALMRPAPPPLKRVPCSKVGYPDEEAAAAALLHAWRHPSPRRRERRYYECPACGYFHLTSQPLSRESTS